MNEKIKNFDLDFYLSQYPDVARSGMDPKIHYQRFGQFEGRKANQDDQGLLSSDMEELFPGVSKIIHPADEMFLFEKNNPNILFPEALYLSNGQFIFDDVLKALDLVGFKLDQAKSFLDFASGYGRVTRFWCQRFPPDSIWAADVQHAGIDFQIKNFGVNGVYSFFDPKEVQLPLKFDLISVISLFTHLPKPRFREWLRFLIDSLSPHGLLIFSVHNENLLEKTEQSLLTDGFLFAPASESGTLPVLEYGTTYVSDYFLEQEIASIDGARILKVLPRGLCDFQDLVVVVRN
jgi:SAM-dependent methyltransferase